MRAGWDFGLFWFYLQIVCWATGWSRKLQSIKCVFPLFFYALSFSFSNLFCRIHFFPIHSEYQFFCLKANEWYTSSIQPQNRLNDQINEIFSLYASFNIHFSFRVSTTWESESNNFQFSICWLKSENIYSMTFLIAGAADWESSCSYLLVDQQNAIDIQFQIEKVQSELHVVLGIKISRQKLISSLCCLMPRLASVPLSALAAFFYCFVSLLSYLFYRQCDSFFSCISTQQLPRKVCYFITIFQWFYFYYYITGHTLFLFDSRLFFLRRAAMLLLRYFEVAILLHRTKLRFYMSISWNR